MPMIDMAKSAFEVTKEKADWSAPMSAAAMVDKYPWGLSISFDQDTLEKLGLDGAMPDVGSVFKFTAEARITSASQNERESSEGGTKMDNRVEAQIVKMSVGDDAPKPRAAWYGSAAPAKAEGDSA